MVNDILYHSKVLSICINKNFRFRSPLRYLANYSLSALASFRFKLHITSFLCIDQSFSRTSLFKISAIDYAISHVNLCNESTPTVMSRLLRCINGCQKLTRVPCKLFVFLLFLVEL